LSSLSAEDFVRILREPDASLCQQYEALLGTEGVQLVFRDDGLERLAQIAYQVNERSENIGARRLHTVMERLLSSVSYDAADRAGDRIEIDGAYVDRHLSELAGDEDLSRYIL
jgi:ATP-dependent HslUV protease ATP-binding subunit HslU